LSQLEFCWQRFEHGICLAASSLLFLFCCQVASLHQHDKNSSVEISQEQKRSDTMDWALVMGCFYWYFFFYASFAFSLGLVLGLKTNML
jgi:hypothetical protein